MAVKKQKAKKKKQNKAALQIRSLCKQAVQDAKGCSQWVEEGSRSLLLHTDALARFVELACTLDMLSPMNESSSALNTEQLLALTDDKEEADEFCLADHFSKIRTEDEELWQKLRNLPFTECLKRIDAPQAEILRTRADSWYAYLGWLARQTAALPAARQISYLFDDTLSTSLRKQYFEQYGEIERPEEMEWKLRHIIFTLCWGQILLIFRGCLLEEKKTPAAINWTCVRISQAMGSYLDRKQLPKNGRVRIPLNALEPEEQANDSLGKLFYKIEELLETAQKQNYEAAAFAYCVSAPLIEAIETNDLSKERIRAEIRKISGDLLLTAESAGFMAVPYWANLLPKVLKTLEEICCEIFDIFFTEDGIHDFVQDRDPLCTWMMGARGMLEKEYSLDDLSIEQNMLLNFMISTMILRSAGYWLPKVSKAGEDHLETVYMLLKNERRFLSGFAKDQNLDRYKPMAAVLLSQFTSIEEWCADARSPQILSRSILEQTIDLMDNCNEFEEHAALQAVSDVLCRLMDVTKIDTLMLKSRKQRKYREAIGSA